MRGFAQEQLDKWQTTFAMNPIYAMENSDSTVVYAAELELAIKFQNIVEYGLEKEFSHEAIVAEVKKDALETFTWKASNITNCSTSQAKNLMEKARVEVAAKFCKFVQSF
jgi:hypothetical protein